MIQSATTNVLITGAADNKWPTNQSNLAKAASNASEKSYVPRIQSISSPVNSATSSQ